MKTSRLSLEVTLKEIDFILQRVFPFSEKSFENDPLMQRATVMSLIIIGEETQSCEVRVDTNLGECRRFG
jgi:uncharacterized protein with HEPN domain